MLKILAYNPDDRLSARQALRHAYFRELRHSDAEQKQKAKAQDNAALLTDRGEKQTRGDKREDHAHDHESDSQQTTTMSSKLVRAVL